MGNPEIGDSLEYNGPDQNWDSGPRQSSKPDVFRALSGLTRPLIQRLVLIELGASHASPMFTNSQSGSFRQKPGLDPILGTAGLAGKPATQGQVRVVPRPAE